MATEETTISDLELTEDILPDMLTPVENASETKATTFSAIKNWLAGFFVSKTDNQTISGVKTFDNNGKLILIDTAARSLTLKSSQYDINNKNAQEYYGIVDFRDKNNKMVARWDTWSKNVNEIMSRFLVWNKNGQASAIELHIDDDGTQYTSCPVPPPSDNSTKIATTSWVQNEIQSYTTEGFHIIKMKDWWIADMHFPAKTNKPTSYLFPTPLPSAPTAMLCDTEIGSDSLPRITSINTTSLNIGWRVWAENGVGISGHVRVILTGVNL